MELRADVRIPHAPQLVFAACRDGMAKLLPYLPSIRSIEEKSRTERGNVVENVVDWCSGGDLPAPLRAVIGPSLLSWTDHARWYADSLSCDWHTETHAFKEAVVCRARDRFIEDGPGGTLLEIRGMLAVDGRRIAGVPGFLAQKVGRSMEAYLVGKIQSDLVKTGDGLARLLERELTASRAPGA